MNHSNPLISIIILNWNGYLDSSECIKSLQNINYSNINIILVDNGSTTNDYEKLEKNFTNIDLIKSNNNLGFTGGNNLGINYAIKGNPDYILLLNNDTIVEPNFIEPLLEVFQKNPNAGIAAPQINYFYERQKIWTSGGKISRLRGSGFAYSDQLEDESSPEFKTVTFVSGCCMLIKREALEQIGFLDDNYFLYVEDADLCFRNTKAGYKIIVARKSKIFHKVSFSTKESLSYLPLYYVTRNRLYFAKKNFNNIYFITFIYILLSMMIKSIKWIASGESKNIQIIRMAFKDFFLGVMGKTDHNIFKSK